MAETRCLQCGSERIRRSRRHSRPERIIAILGASPQRCHECDARFVRIGSSLIRARDFRRATEIAMFAVAMAAAAILVLTVVLWFSRAPSSPSGGDSASVGVSEGSFCQRVLTS